MRSTRSAAGLCGAVLLAVSCAALAASAPDQEGGERLRLDGVRAAARELPRLHSLLVSWQGELALEYYGRGIRPSRPANVKSVSKSVVSALVGIAIERDLLDGVSTPIARYFPALLEDEDPRKRRITVEDLLSMRSGLESTSSRNYGAWVTSRNWVRHVLTRPMVSMPGTTMEYSTGSSHLLSAILTRVTRSSTYQFARETLGRPLGWTLAPWPRDPQGIYFGGNDMLLTPRQMLAFGELYLRRGEANGRQVVPAGWVRTSCLPRGRSRFNPDQFYGYGWWIRDFAGHASCFAWGFGGQYIFVFPGLDLVVVTTSTPDVSDERRGHRRMIFDILEREIIPQVEAAAVNARARGAGRGPAAPAAPRTTTR